VTQPINTAAAQPNAFDRVVNRLLWAWSSFLGAFTNLGLKKRLKSQNIGTPMLRIRSTKYGKLVPTGFLHSKAGCHSLTVRHISACSLTLMMTVWVRFVKWNGLNTITANKVAKPAATV